MHKAVDENGSIVTIADAKSKTKLYCRCCNKRVYYVAGNPGHKFGKCSHFRHYRGCLCTDDWNHDKTQWHKDWQDCFPIENQEVIVENQGKKHIADVFIPESKVVVEFQHSHISPNEFNERNEFYMALGFRVIWVFDTQKQFSRNRIGIGERGYDALREAYYWDTPIDCLDNYELNTDVDIFLQIIGDDVEIKLLRVSRSDPGFKLFYAPNIFSKEVFVRFVFSPDHLSKYRFHYSKEELERFRDMRFKGMDCNGRKTVLGCPLVTSGNEIFVEKCRQCPFYTSESGERIGCMKHYLSMSVFEMTNAGEVYRNALEQTERIELSAIPNERPIIVNNPIGKTIREIWGEYLAAGVVILLNLHTGSMIKMCKKWYLEGKDEDRFLCEIRMKGYQRYLKERKQILFPGKSQFKVLWWKPPV
ncbi:MAG: hypothetical protein IKP61_02395 [Spirochaetales bacterium]|nr:hypothetical protein [Spirochaetales bacterium]